MSMQNNIENNVIFVKEKELGIYNVRHQRLRNIFWELNSTSWEK